MALERLQELHEVLSHGLRLHERLVLRVVVLQHERVLVVLVAAEDLEDLLDGCHLKLLVEGVEGGRPVGPELGLALCRQVAPLLQPLVFFLDRLRDLFCPVRLDFNKSSVSAFID